MESMTSEVQMRISALNHLVTAHMLQYRYLKLRPVQSIFQAHIESGAGPLHIEFIHFELATYDVRSRYYVLY